MRRDQPAIRLGGPPPGTASPPFGSEGRHSERPAHHSARDALGSADFILGAIAVSAFGHLGAEKPSSHATSGREPAA